MILCFNSPSKLIDFCCSVSCVQCLATPWTACPLLSPRLCSNPCPLSQWCHPTISSSVVPFSSCLQSFPVSGTFLVSWLFASGCWSIRASTFSESFSISRFSEYSRLISFRIDWFDRHIVQESSPAPQFESINSSAFSLFYDPVHTTIDDYSKNYNFY